MSDYFENSAALQLKPFKKPIAEIIDELRKDTPSFIAEMKTDPTGYLLSKIYPDSRIDSVIKVSAANRFLFAILANDGFRDWFKDYHDSIMSKGRETEFVELNPDQIRKDFAAGLAEHADERTMKALLEATSIGPIELLDRYNASLNPRVAAAVVGPVAVAVAVAAIAVACLVYVARTSPFEEMRSGTLNEYLYSGNELVMLADEMVQTAQSLRDEGKL